MSRSRTIVAAASLSLCLAACGTPGQAPTAAGGQGPTFGHLGPPAATPLAIPPTAPVPGGGTATITTPDGTIVIQLYGGSAPVATANFVALAKAGYYDGVVFHRIVPGFVIQGGDGLYGREPHVDAAHVGSGSPGYTIVDEPVVGDYTRGIVAMARTSQPDSASSQFFICLADLRQELDKSGGYVIFGLVTAGMDVVDRIAAGPSSGSPDDLASQPVPMTHVTVTP